MGKTNQSSKSTGRPKPLTSKAGVTKNPRRRYGEGGKAN